ncbi:hypothetical protein CCR75_002935 [Bremia lactucae]|uniref:Uncharacterized protein n=1 Tax=Bremia lactucae TaxID=4779 RepID=A0A976FPQ4_BRELC|nr:hypothetical protein CCR75_002935 [Bremia lactucae]
MMLNKSIFALCLASVALYGITVEASTEVAETVHYNARSAYDRKARYGDDSSSDDINRYAGRDYSRGYKYGSDRYVSRSRDSKYGASRYGADRYARHSHYRDSKYDDGRYVDDRDASRSRNGNYGAGSVVGRNAGANAGNQNTGAGLQPTAALNTATGVSASAGNMVTAPVGDKSKDINGNNVVNGPATTSLTTDQKTSDSVTQNSSDPAVKMTTNPATQNTLDPATQNASDAETQKTTDPVTQKPADPATQKPTDPVTQNAADPVVQKTSDLVTQKTGDQVTQMSAPGPINTMEYHNLRS